MIEQIDHAAAVVRRMREFLRRGEPQLGSLGVRMVLDEALALVQPLANSKRIALSVEVPDTMPPMHGDRVQLQQVVINLVRNAIEAILEADRADGRIRLTARLSADAKEVEVRVLDNGIGIAPDRASSVFEPLVTSRPDGIGLGLAICKSIVQVHHGRIWLTSQEPGWTEFGFTVPTAAVHSRGSPTT
jgi:two-component system sensor histidine kinase DctS